jgi:DNA-binding MarR family transcriptional regulator
LRQFEHWSAERAAEHALTASQHQLLLAIRGHADADGPTISQAAEYLLVRHHSAVELIDRSENIGLVQRVRDAEDHRVVRLRLSMAGEQILADLASAHLEELARLTPLFQSLLDNPGQPLMHDRSETPSAAIINTSRIVTNSVAGSEAS